tara:strand:+ start:69 stop:293 length:225 start_codon:yes stop_codon:yes gene_type:complete
MKDHHTHEKGLTYKPNYKWPNKGESRDCPRCKNSLELIEENVAYYGKPWWCFKCQWQFSEEDLELVKLDSKEEE